METKEEGQKLIDEWFADLPNEVNKHYKSLEKNIQRFETFDLLANICSYNHMSDSSEYKDYRGDKHFFVPEVLTLLCLKKQYSLKNTVTVGNYLSVLADIQKDILAYCSKKDAMESRKKMRGENTVSDIADILQREAKVIRNPGSPDHPPTGARLHRVPT